MSKVTKQIFVGNVAVGGGAPISIQSMTNTDTSNAESTLAQVMELANTGADIVRISVPNEKAIRGFETVVKKSPVPLVADIHYDQGMGVLSADAGAACVRINPGNIGSEAGIAKIVDACKANKCPIRIGINAGSLEQDLLNKYGEPCADAMVVSAINQIKMLENHNFYEIKLSLKSSNTLMTIEAYEKIAKLIEYPLHVGITEAGTMRAGSVKNAIGIGHLLLQGIGDTIRVSLSEDPVEEVKVGWDILKALKLRSRGLDIISCPTCARRGIDIIAVANELERRCTDITKPIRVAVMGCIVNGKGEVADSDIGLIGIDLNTGKSDIYIGGKKSHSISNSNAVLELEKMIRKHIDNS
ncbi:MAG: flavodoxin-dependent (E)-4-hydroxy-3-methylbut-2-enyl-diphosphate synthase [Treponema sp.]|nr:flavodoxin-dependent (E)-4-hydroxy-3-methylbut-2-enyl-diphosphate synthase [Treponema sp.]